MSTLKPFASNTILLIGLFTEFIGIITVANRIIADSNKVVVFFTILTIILIISQHYFILRGFETIERDPNIKSKSYCNWVLHKNKFELFLRFLIFILFVGLSGQITYIAIISKIDLLKMSNHLGDNFLVHMDKIYSFLRMGSSDMDLNLMDGSIISHQNLYWVPFLFIRMALTLSILLLTWDLFGLRYEYKKSNPISNAISGNNPNNFFLKLKSKFESILEFSLKNELFYFAINDFVAFWIWLSIFFLIVEENKQWLDGIKFWAILFIIITILRFIFLKKIVPSNTIRFVDSQ